MKLLLLTCLFIGLALGYRNYEDDDFDFSLTKRDSFVIHISWKVDSDERMEPPIQTEYFLSGGATILTLTADGALAVMSLFRRLSIPGNIVEPPDRTVLVYRSQRMSTSHFWIESYASWSMPPDSFPMREGLNRGSQHRKRSFPIVITWPSGSSYCFSISALDSEAANSASKSSAQ